MFFVCGVLCVISALPIGVLHCSCRRHSLHAAVKEAVQVDRQMHREERLVAVVTTTDQVEAAVAAVEVGEKVAVGATLQGLTQVMV